MKQILFIAFIVFGMKASGQIAFEQAYDSAATWNICNGNVNQLMIVKFEVSGDQYVKINRCGKLISVYKMNHALVKNISLAGVPQPQSIVGSILYLSENLFDMDPGMEFMYISDSGGFFTTKIYNEDGSMLFSENGVPLVILNVHLQQYPIYNTSAGTKLILSYENGQAKVFGLPGTLNTAIEAVNEELLEGSNLISNPYPNPANSATRVDYTLPPGVNQGEIVFYDLWGKEIKRFDADKISDHLLISTSDIAAGTYYYQLQTAVQNSEGKKIVIIK